MQPEYLYVHAPFCARRCSYCDFAVHVASEPPVEPWAEAVGGELKRLADQEGWDEPLELRTLYLGGGTPSLLGIGAIARLREALEATARLDGVTEFTAEANPESFTPELARDWVASGVGRVSFGAQTFHEPTLRWMGRLHGPEGPGRAVRIARAAGVDNLSLDLIFAVPERLGRSLDDDLDRLLALEPEHVSVYGLTVEEETPLGRWVDAGREAMPDDERYREEYLRLSDRLKAEGFVHYEVSNFGRPGREAVHNQAYWQGVPYIGLGNGAHSYLPPRRWWNRRDWFAYRTEVAGGGSGREDEERVSAEDARLERVWLGLRTREGLGRDELTPEQERLVGGWRRSGLAEADDGRVRLTTEGWLVLDRLAVELSGAVVA